MSAQLSGNDHGKDICLRCLNAFGRLTKKERQEDPERKSLLEKHKEICSSQKLQRSVYPKPGDTIKFKNYERIHEIPFSVCADFESFTSQMLPQIPKETMSGKKHDRLGSLELLKQKGVFPYEYMTDFSKLSVTSLPPKDAFYSQLYKTGISDEDYAHAKKVWHAFNCKTMRDYHDLYLKTDVLLLTDIMSEFRRV